MVQMQWRTALVTGASSGIGAALGKRLARCGVEVVLAARRVPELEALEAEIRADGGRARCLELDVCRPDEAVARIREIDDEIGGLDLVVANAGIGRPQPARTLSWEEGAQVFATNFTGAMATLTAVLPRMVERGRGHLVGVSSMIVYASAPGGSAYRATKCGMTAFLESVRFELEGSGVHATAVHPGFVRTPMADAFELEPPVVVPVEEAAELIVRRLASAPARIDFPLSILLPMRVLGSLPRLLQSELMRRMQLAPAPEDRSGRWQLGANVE